MLFVEVPCMLNIVNGFVLYLGGLCFRRGVNMFYGIKTGKIFVITWCCGAGS